MHMMATVGVLTLAWAAPAADLESRVLTHYVPQDLLEAAVRKEGWTEVPLAVAGGVRKGDTVRLWCGGKIDAGNGDQPGQFVCPPTGFAKLPFPLDPLKLALSPDPGHAFGMLFKTDQTGPRKALPQGKPLEIALRKDKEKLWVGYNDERGRYYDNRLGAGQRHEFDPLWIRVEVVRTVTD